MRTLIRGLLLCLIIFWLLAFLVPGLLPRPLAYQLGLFPARVIHGFAEAIPGMIVGPRLPIVPLFALGLLVLLLAWLAFRPTRRAAPRPHAPAPYAEGPSATGAATIHQIEVLMDRLDRRLTDLETRLLERNWPGADPADRTDRP